jgi:hypothetical protein
MNAKTIAVLSMFVLVATLALRDVTASQPPPEQVEEAAEVAQMIPAQWTCVWLNERTCVSEKEWERLMRDFDDE